MRNAQSTSNKCITLESESQRTHQVWWICLALSKSKINTTDTFTSCKEEAEDDTYMLMLCSESQLAMTLKAQQNPRDQSGIQSGCQQEAEVDEEKKDHLEDSREETEDEDQEQEDPYSFDHSPDELYASIPDHLNENKRPCFLSKGPPPPPPHNPPGIQRLGDLHNLSQGTNVVEDKSERERGDGLTADRDTCEEDSEEEYPYSFAGLDESVCAFILAEEDEEKRKERRSFVMNGPPAPAPCPMCSVVRENAPYIMQVFQQKASEVPSAHSRTYYDVRKPAALGGHTDTATESTVKHNSPAEQQELIHLQEQVKKGTISVDGAFDRFKQWQKEKQRLQSPRQEKVQHLRATTIGHRLGNESQNCKLPLLCLPEHGSFGLVNKEL